MTAYEMRISDWSSDVCSSDLVDHERAVDGRRIDPLAVNVAHLQTTGGVLVEQGDATVIGMGAGTLLLGRTGGVTRRIVNQAQHAHWLVETCVEEVPLDAEGQGHGAQQCLCKCLHVAVVRSEEHTSELQSLMR